MVKLKMQQTAVVMTAWLLGMSLDVFRYASVKDAKKTGLAGSKRYFTGTGAEVWGKLHIDRGYVNDQGNCSMKVGVGSGWIVAFHARNRFSQAVKVGSNPCKISDTKSVSTRQW